MSLPSRWDWNDKMGYGLQRWHMGVCFRLWACVKIRALVFTSLPRVHFSSSLGSETLKCFRCLGDESFVREGWRVKLLFPCFSVDFSSFIIVVCWNIALSNTPRVLACGSNIWCAHRRGTFLSGFPLPSSPHPFILRSLLTIFTPYQVA